MRKHIVLIDYTVWHYSRALRDGWRIWTTLLWFVVHFFGIPLHLMTLFSRFKKLGESYPHGLTSFYEILSAFIVNTIMRFVGMILRIGIISVGTVALVVVLVFGSAFFLLWFLFPLAVLALWIIGALMLLGI